MHKRHWIWVVLFVLALGWGVLSSQSWQSALISDVAVKQLTREAVQPEQLTPQTPGEIEQTELKTTAIAPAINVPKVDPQRLMGHVQALAFARHSDRDRYQAREYILQALTEAGWKPYLQVFRQGVNVVAERSGTDPQAGRILVAAHYDTVAGSPGADDNGTGVATTLEVARLLGSRSTPRGLQVVFFDQEEQGLLGSFAFAANPSYLENLQGVIIPEMLGYACYEPGCQTYPRGLPFQPPTEQGDFLFAAGDQEHLPLLSAFQQDQLGLPAVFTLPIPLRGLMSPDFLRSDHAPFWQQGIGAVVITDTANFRTPHYHQPSDTLATLDQQFFAGAAQIVVNATATLLESRLSLATEPNHI
jgi:Zn-dependent M28 family amino/carboxypeptidase